MKISFKKSRFLTSVASAALVATAVVAIPSTAQAADPQCATASYVTQCAGAGSDGAPFLMIAAANFNGTVFIWSHGIRPAINIPASLAPVGPYTITNAAEPGPGASEGDMTVINSLVAAGYGVAGSGYSRQSINVTEALNANVELIAAFKKKFPTTKKVIAWGKSLGAMHSQKLAETHPELVDGTVLACPAANPSNAMINYFGDALYGFKAYFDPSIKVGGYSTDPVVRQGEQLANIGKVLTVLGKLSAGLVSGAWPDTASPAGKALEKAGVPSRSALLAVGLMAGIPTRSKHVDGTSGPAGSAELYPLAIAPAVAILENMGTVGVAGSLLLADGELLTGGKVFDNSKTDYAARLSSDRDIFSMALGGNTSVDALVGALAATPRETADAAAVAKIPSIIGIKGEITKPTVMIAAESDEYTPASIAQWYVDSYGDKFAAAKDAALAAAKSSRDYKAPVNKMVMLWAKTAPKYSTFTAAGSPDLSGPVGAGTGHCYYTSAQWLAAAKMVAGAVNTGKFPNQGPITSAARKVGLTYDKKFRVPTFKSLA
ncbi:MhpC Predicted hydrolases or acyltransferases (alpha/beta hydrolase superfamily) [Candidatus Nanopelagicaceae bacterium]